MKYKALLVFFFGIVLSLISIQNSFAGWPVAATPAIEGHVLEATTNQPIENAILEVIWTTSKMGIADRSGGRAGYKLIATDKEGYYRIPAKVMLQPLGGLFSKFDGMRITVRHPLYEGKSFNRIMNEKVISLLKLEDKFITEADNSKLASEIIEYWYYYYWAKSISLNVNKENGVNELERLINRFPSSKDKGYLLEYLNHIKQEIDNIGDK